MSIAIVNASVAGLLTVGGTTTLTGALTSGSTLNAQGITSTTLNLTNNLVQSGTGNLASGTGGISCNGNLVVSGNTIINSNCNVLGNINLSRDLVAGSTTITNASLGFISGLGSNAQTQISNIIPTLLAQTNAWTGLNTYNTNIPTTTISATTANQFCNKTYTDTADTTTITNLKAAANTWTGVNTWTTAISVFNVLPTTVVTATTSTQMTNKATVDSLITTNNTTLTNANNSWNGTNSFFGAVNVNNSCLFTTAVPQTSILPTSGAMLTNKTYVDASFTTLRGATNSWTGVNTFNNNVVLPTATYLSDAGLFLRGVGDVNHKLQYNATSDGPALQGVGGCRIGTTTKPDILNITTSAGIFPHKVNIQGNCDVIGNLNLTPYASNGGLLSAYTLNCNAITCLGQIIASGVGLLTTKLQCSANGTGILGLQCGSFQAVTDANQTVTFPNAFLGTNAPLVFLQPKYANAVSGTVYVITTSLTSFTYRFFFDGSVNSESAVLMYWSAYQI